MPRPLIALFALTLGLLACGGGGGSAPLPPTPAVWSALPTFPGEAVMGASAFVVGNRAYVGTGERAWKDVRSALFAFDSERGAWIRRADFAGGGRADAVAFALGSIGFLGLGHDSQGLAQRDLWAYDPGLDQWTRRADFPGSPRHRPAAAVVADRAYVVGGMSIEGTLYTARKDTWAYNAAADTWTRRADFPGEGRWGAIAFALGTKLYVGFGEGETALTPSFWEYDTLADTWTRKGDFPGRRRYALVGLALGSRGYLGTGNDPFAFNQTLSDLWEYDGTTDRWTERLPIPAPGREGAVGFVLGSHLCIGLGANQTGTTLGDFWRFAP